MAHHLGIRVSDEFMERFNALREAIQERQAIEGVEVSQTALLKALIARALPLIEAEVTGRVHGKDRSETEARVAREIRRLQSLVSDLQFEHEEPVEHHALKEQLRDQAEKETWIQPEWLKPEEAEERPPKKRKRAPKKK